MNVYWLEQTEHDVPAENTWLSSREILSLEGFRFAKRRGDWRLGRWTAKNTVALHQAFDRKINSLARIEVRPMPSGAPELFIDQQRTNLRISLSHGGGRALCILGSADARIGCDLERIEERSGLFLEDYFTLNEQRFVMEQPAAERASVLTILWSAKESALKLLREGLRLDTRSVSISLESIPAGCCDWHPLAVHYGDADHFSGWWQREEDFIRTIVSDPPPERLIQLHSSTNGQFSNWESESCVTSPASQTSAR